MAIMIELPGGDTAVLKDDTELTNREVKNMQRASRVAASVVGELERLGYKEDDPEAWKAIAGLSDEDYDSLDLFQRTCVIIRLKSWTLDRPLPQDVDEVDDLPVAVYTPLTIAAVKIGFDEGFDKESGTLDPKAVTAGSGN
jgi:hypothetical protein